MKKKRLWIGIFAVTAIVAVFAFFRLKAERDVANQWNMLCLVAEAVLQVPINPQDADGQYLRQREFVDLVRNEVSRPEVLNALIATAYLEPERKFAFLKSEAEYDLQQPWACPALEKIFGQP